MGQRNKNKLVMLVIAVMCVLTLSSCSSENLEYDSGTALDVFDYTTIYYDDSIPKDEINSDLGKTKFSLDVEHSEEQKDIYNKRTTTSIKDLGGLNIVVDNVKKSLEISSDIEGKTKQIYDSIMDNLKAEKIKYLTLYKSLELSNSEIANIKYDKNSDKITIDFSLSGRVDTRFLDITVNNGNGLTKEELKPGDNKLRIIETTDKPGYVVFKSDAIYGIALTENGERVLESAKTLKSKQLLVDESGRVYQGITMDSVISNVGDRLKKPEGLSKLEIETIKDVENNEKDEIILYVENEAIDYKDDITRILESLGFSIQITEDCEMCDLIIGYTWLYNNSLQSTFDDRVNDAIINYHNKSELKSTVGFIVRSSWTIGR